jgi:hypothetical protein
MKESCRCWRADHGGMVQNRDVTSGLWSVSRRNWRPSSKNLKCLTALKAASSSLSKVEYLVPAPDNFLPSPACQLLKHATDVCVRGVCGEREHDVPGWVCQWYRSRQGHLGPSEGGGGHTSVLGAPLSASVSGCNVRAIPGRNLL